MQYLFDTGMLEIEAVTYIRGRSLPKLFIIIDEAQNLTPHEVKTVVSRAGEDSKVILTGDAYQIDNPYLDAVEQRPDLRGRAVQGPAHLRAHHPGQERTQHPGQPGGDAIVIRAAGACRSTRVCLS